MVLPARTFLILGVALCVFAPRWSKAECAYDFAAGLNVQILNENTQMPIGDLLNNWSGTAWVREGKLIDIELWSYRVDLRFRDVGEHRYEVTVVLQERTNGSDALQMAGEQNPNPTYRQLNSTALTYKGEFGAPLVLRPNIGGVILDLTLYAYPKES